MLNLCFLSTLVAERASQLGSEAMPAPVSSSSSRVLRLAGAGARSIDQGRSAMDVGDERRQPQPPTGRLRPAADESVFGQLSSLLSALCALTVSRSAGSARRGYRHRSLRQRHRADQAECLAGRLLQCPRAAQPANFRQPAPGVQRDRRRLAGAGRGADVAEGNPPGQAARVAHPRSARPLAGARNGRTSWLMPARSGSIPTRGSTRIRGI